MTAIVVHVTNVTPPGSANPTVGEAAPRGVVRPACSPPTEEKSRREGGDGDVIIPAVLDDVLLYLLPPAEHGRWLPAAAAATGLGVAVQVGV
jgi:hypothetical protein